MMLQSRDGIVRILPAIPEDWKDGAFRGLCIRGGYEADAEWKDGKVTSFTIRSTVGEGNLKVVVENKVFNMKFSKGKSITKTL